MNLPGIEAGLPGFQLVFFEIIVLDLLEVYCSYILDIVAIILTGVKQVKHKLFYLMIRYIGHHQQ